MLGCLDGVILTQREQFSDNESEQEGIELNHWFSDHERQQDVSPHQRSPPLSTWIIPALSCAISYALYNIFIKIGSSSIHPILGGLILECVAAFVGIIALVSLLLTRKKNQQNGEESQWKIDTASIVNAHHIHGIWWSVGAGVWVGIAETLSFVVSGPMGIPVTQSMPIIIGGSVFFGAVLSSIFLRESMTITHGWVGITLLTGGIILVATLENSDDNNLEDSFDYGNLQQKESSVPLSLWISLALCCAVSYAFYNISIKQGSNWIHPIVGGVVLQVVAACFGLSMVGAILIYEKTGARDPENKFKLHFDAYGVICSSLAGIAVGIAELLSFAISGMGVQASQSIPILIGGSVAFGAIFGVLFLGEMIGVQGWIGVILLIVGIGLVGTDPVEN